MMKSLGVDHDHSAYVDQWDWERVITADQRNLDFLKGIISKIWKVIVGAERYAQSLFPQLKDFRYPDLPEKLEFFHAEEILDMYPDLPRKQRETEILQKHPAIFIIGIGWPLKDGYPHEMRAADYDDWVTDTHEIVGQNAGFVSSLYHRPIVVAMLFRLCIHRVRVAPCESRHNLARQ